MSEFMHRVDLDGKYSDIYCIILINKLTVSY